MARVTIEDCLEVVDNRFDLVIMASRRARQLAKGAQSSLDGGEQDDKPTVLALREIAMRAIDQSAIEEEDRVQHERREREALEWVAAEVDDDLMKAADDL